MKSEIVEAILSGILDANEFYFDISGGWWVSDDAVENILQYTVAKSLHDLVGPVEGGMVWLECSMARIIDWSGATKKRGKLPTLISGRKRVDIVVASKDRAPLVPIEIKRNALSDGFWQDGRRILKLLERCDTLGDGTVKFGAICAFIHSSGLTREEANSNIKLCAEKCREKVVDRLGVQNSDFFQKMTDAKEFDGQGWWAGGAVCVYLRRRSG